MYQSKMGIIRFRIIGEQKIPKGQTCGKNYTTFGDKISDKIVDRSTMTEI